MHTPKKTAPYNKVSRVTAPALTVTLSGFRVSAVSQLGNLYYHNSHDINSYQTACRNQQLPPATGVLCTKKDQIHRAVIQALTCQFEVNFSVIEQCFAIDFASYFAAQWPQLLRMQSNGLLELERAKTEHHRTRALIHFDCLPVI